MDKNKKQLGLWMLTALVSGNMIGSGVFLLPSSLAKIGSISLFSWCFTAFGAILLAIVFARMSLLIPKSGGPYAYAQAGFGNFVGFQTAYNYWIAIWVGNAAIVLAMIGYLTVFFPVLDNHVYCSIVAICTIWFLTFMNIVGGVGSAGILQIITTILKLIPILLIAVFGWFYFHPSYLTQSVNLTNTSNFSAISSGATLTLWAFIGLESATVPADCVENPRVNIPLATLLGTLIAAFVYISSSVAIMGMIPSKILVLSESPFADAAGIILGVYGKWFIAVGAAISCFGCLNGWILLQAQIPMAAADDNLFPSIFSKRNKNGIPACGLVITSILVTILLLMTTNQNLLSKFKLIILIATLASLLPYFYTAIAEIILLKSEKSSISNSFHKLIATCAAIYACWAIFGSGSDVLFYGIILMFSSVPLYAFVLGKKSEES